MLYSVASLLVNTTRDMATAHSIKKRRRIINLVQGLRDMSSYVFKIRLNRCVTLRATPSFSF